MPEREQKRKATTSRTEEVVEELPAQAGRQIEGRTR